MKRCLRVPLSEAPCILQPKDPGQSPTADIALIRSNPTNSGSPLPHLEATQGLWMLQGGGGGQLCSGDLLGSAGAAWVGGASKNSLPSVVALCPCTLSSSVWTSGRFARALELMAWASVSSSACEGEFAVAVGCPWFIVGDAGSCERDVDVGPVCSK